MPARSIYIRFQLIKSTRDGRLTVNPLMIILLDMFQTQEM
jgi:hypothetical protein